MESGGSKEVPIKLGRPLLGGKRALVTGAAGAIGRSIVLALAWEGADIAVHYHTKKEPAEAMAKMVNEMGHRAVAYQADISDYDAVARMKEAVNRDLGRVDILVNNAGLNVDVLFSKMPKEAWHAVMNVNLDGLFHMSRIFLEDIQASEAGRIINITSIVGQRGNIGQTNYAASKAGIIGFTRALAKELGRTKTTVNAVAPGFVQTSMLDSVPEKVKARLIDLIPLRRFGKPEEVASAVVFLASEQASYITGCVLDVNGGMYL